MEKHRHDMAFIRQDEEYREEERRRERDRYHESKDGHLTREQEKRDKEMAKHELHRQQVMILHQLGNGSLRKWFWMGETEHDYPHLLDVQFKKNPDMALWMEKRRVKQQWVCFECGVAFGRKNCGKCPKLDVHCMEKGCKIECKECTDNQKHYLGDYQIWLNVLKASYHESDESRINWAEELLTSLTIDDESRKRIEETGELPGAPILVPYVPMDLPFVRKKGSPQTVLLHDQCFSQSSDLVAFTILEVNR